MKPFLKLNFLLIFIIISSLNSTAQDNYSKKIDTLIKINDPVAFNGVIYISKQGKPVYFKAFGYANLDDKTPISTGSSFEIMSNTKQFTTVLLLKEVEKGKVDLQAPIRKYLPFLSPSWADTVTVHQLLNHTHGIIDINKPLAFAAGSDFKYGNLSNELLGKIIEFSSKKTYVEMAQALFKSLKMTHTFCYSKDGNKNLVSGHLVENGITKVVKNSFINLENMPADGIITTAEALAIWNAHLHKGKVLKPKSYKLMTSESVKSQHNVFGKEKMGYGYNIRIAHENGIQYLGHTGLGDGFSSLNIYIPKYDVSIIVLENQMNESSSLFYYFETKIKEIVLKSNLVK